MSCLLIDRVPETVEIDNTTYGINADFRTGIRLELLMDDRSLSEKEKLAEALILFYPVLPDNIDQAIEKILWLYKGESTEYGSAGGAGSNARKQIYSFEHDAEYIYAAFMEQYGINLQTVEHLHWWEFKALFKGLKSDCEIVKIMGYRAIEITSDMSKKEQKYYQKMKDLYKIPIAKSDQAKIDALNQILLGDGDLSKL